MKMKKMLTAAVMLMTALSGSAASKVIDLSWSNPTVDYLEKHIQEMNRTAPVDGLTIRVRGEQVKWKEKNLFAFQYLWSGCPLEYSHFEKEVARLKKIPFGRFTDNFLYSTTYSYDTDWFNDAEWKTVAANFGVAARAAREAGLKGFLFDIEEYGKKFWNYNNLNTKTSPEETRKIIYKRGQQWGKAVFAAYPDITLFMPFMLTMGHVGPLTVPFVNGIMSVMPPQARIIEGSEEMGYHSSTPEAYFAVHRRYWNAADDTAVVYPENRTKYLTQTSFAPAFYLDAYVREKLQRWYSLKPQILRDGILTVFRRNLAAAVSEGREYIWLYGEHGCWWNGSPHREAQRTWEQQVPGFTDVVREVMVPELQKISPANLLKNGNFANSSAWAPWQIEYDQKKPVPGTIRVGNGKMVLKNVTRGCADQRLSVKEGEYYLLQFSGINQSAGDAGCNLAYLDGEKHWMGAGALIPLPRTGKKETVSYLFKIPFGVAQISVQLSARNQARTDAGEITFFNVRLLKY